MENLGKVNLSFSDHIRAVYVSLSGTGEINTEREHIERLWTPIARPWFPDGPDSINLVLLKFMPLAGQYWDAPNNCMVRIFDMPSSTVAAKPMVAGKHDSFTQLWSPQVIDQIK